MEMKQIPDYPNYAVTRDGRVWSYNRNRFMYCSRRKAGAVVVLSIEGLRFVKLVRRLVFEAFNGYVPEVVTHRDGNVFNNNIENLVGMTRSEVGKLRYKTVIKPKPICRVEISTGKLDIVVVHRKDKGYSTIHEAVRRRHLTSGGYFYYYPGEKGELIAEIKAHIYSNELSLKKLLLQDKSSPYVSVVKKHIRTNKKYLEVLESI
ncbi:HNH endonuclease signature motif containing protein [Lactococcus lactis]|uniref:HNH endonuclease signature motif containing protein n=1 Tax=Lactococcus lactis TaxID=1358 RepID=UPI00189BEB8C|nr:HNH endonuclease signature motif containing protein [Lactococcus lactis]